jgi:hypothetical protein
MNDAGTCCQFLIAATPRRAIYYLGGDSVVFETVRGGADALSRREGYEGFAEELI